MKRWAVKAKDGWHFSVPNRPHKQEASNVKTACGYFVILPFGCEQRTNVECDACVLAIENK